MIPLLPWYDGNTGGLTGKSDAGIFTYDPLDKPYAIKTIDSTTELTLDSAQTIGYTSFNKVESISENGYEADCIYGSDDLRSRMIVKQSGNAILTRWYPTDSSVKETSGGVTKEYTFIWGDANSAHVAAIMQGGTTTYYNLLRDHLGSITHVVSLSGSVVAGYRYDAWGRMRKHSTWVNYELGLYPALMIARRCYTGHEHLDRFGLINMNGRMYDPVVGRFLGVDPVVQSPDYSQSFNGYSYCLNNPMIYKDMTGYLADVVEIAPENFTKFIAQTLSGLDVGDLAEMYGFRKFESIEEFMQFQESLTACSGAGGWVYSNENEAYNYMWLASGINKVEYGAYILRRGVFVLPIKGKYFDGRSEIANTSGRARFEYYEWGFDNKGNYYIIGPPEIGRTEVLAFIHTHPYPEDEELKHLSADDWMWTDWSGVPIFLLSVDGIFEGGYANPYQTNFPGIENTTRMDITNTTNGLELIPLLIEFYKDR